jgi:hypothetical protein
LVCCVSLLLVGRGTSQIIQKMGDPGEEALLPRSFGEFFFFLRCSAGTFHFSLSSNIYVPDIYVQNHFCQLTLSRAVSPLTGLSVNYNIVSATETFLSFILLVLYFLSSLNALPKVSTKSTRFPSNSLLFCPQSRYHDYFSKQGLDKFVTLSLY